MRKLQFLVILLTGLLCYGFTPPGKTGRRTEIPIKPYENSHFEWVDSIRMHYRIWNDNLVQPRGKVLLIHGFCGSTYCWRYNFEALVTAGYKVIAIDLPGFGYSGRASDLNQSQSYRAKMIWELLGRIDQGDTTKWNIVGHSMGGGTAEAVALTSPEKTSSLIIADGMIFIENNNVNLSVVGLTNNKVFRAILLSYTERSYLIFNNMRRQLKGVYGFKPDTATVYGYLEPLLIDGTAETVVNLIANSKEIIPLSAADLKALPVLLIWGKKDKTIRLKNARKLQRVVPSAELQVIPTARHMPMETNPDEFNRMMVEFLDRNNKR
jgi:pimeloyl-ACP methyl ester carboxylesterase